MQVQWESKIGMASVLGFAQLVALIVGGVYTYAKLENTTENVKAANEALKASQIRQAEKINSTSDRLIVVETTIKSLADNFSRLLAKIDSTKP